MRTTRLFSITLVTLLLSACGSQPPAPEQNPSGLESRTPAAVESAPTTSKIESFDPMSVAALKDPRSPLSKRSIYFDYDSYVVKDEYQPL
ncbi:MAG TPA: peptidoglycan-associated lipoprotein, partial [Rugosibacter sp.]